MAFVVDDTAIDELDTDDTCAEAGTDQAEGPVADTGHGGQRHDRHA